MQNNDYREFVEEQKQAQIPIVLTPAEAMDILGVGKNTMYRLLDSGELKGIRIRRSWKIRLESLETFLAQRG